jgi:hypothetical protein
LHSGAGFTCFSAKQRRIYLFFCKAAKYLLVFFCKAAQDLLVFLQSSAGFTCFFAKRCRIYSPEVSGFGAGEKNQDLCSILKGFLMSDCLVLKLATKQVSA